MMNDELMADIGKLATFKTSKTKFLLVLHLDLTPQPPLPWGEGESGSLEAVFLPFSPLASGEWRRGRGMRGEVKNRSHKKTLFSMY
jgi:hypothetical protein